MVDRRLPFFVAAALAATNLLIAYRRLPESRRAGSPAAPAPRMGLLRRALSRRELGPLLAVSFVATFAFVGMESTFALFGEHRFEYGQVEMGLLFTYIGVLAALSQGVLVGRLVERRGETRVMLAGLAGTSVALLVVAVSESLWLLLVGLALLAVASGLVSPRPRRSSPWRLASASRGRSWGSRPPWAVRPASPGRSWRRCCSSTPGSPPHWCWARRSSPLRGGCGVDRQAQSVTSRGGVTRVCITTQ